MIKINLLGVAPSPSKVSSSGEGTGAPKATLIMIFLGTLVVCFGIVGLVYKIWNNQIDEYQKNIAKEKIIQTELSAVKAQNQKYQEHLRDLETRINTIQALQNSRVGPVELMSTLGNVVNKTNDIYLYTLTPAGDRFELKGQSSTVDSMANFIAYLKNSGTFDDVELSQFYQDDVKDRLTYKFSVSCGFKASNGTASPTGGTMPDLPAGAAGPGGRGATSAPASGPPAPQGMTGAPGRVQQSLKQGI
jgi:Tfp pilus assembly protein PilN